jgi:tRNA1(Val) A37 N6-methylase TrmN6
MTISLSEDRLLGGRVRLGQTRDGLRAAIDPVLLAAAVPAADGERVLDLGTGSGAAALCLAARVAGVGGVGLELQPELAALAADNVRLNDLAPRVSIVAGDVARPCLAERSFDHVMANPPYLARGTGTLPPSRAKALAIEEGAVPLARWIGSALALVRPRGTVTVIHRADRLADLLAAFAEGAGEIVIFPLWPGLGKPAARILVRARRGVRTPLRLAAGLTLHAPDGRYTEAAERVLRDAAALAL